MKQEFGLTVMSRSNGHIVLDYGWFVCAGIPYVGSGLAHHDYD